MSGTWLNRHMVLKKVTTAVALCAFFTCFVLSEAQAAVDVGGAPYKMMPPEEALFARIDADTFTIPAHLGDVKYIFKGTSDKFVVHLQDAHCNRFAQHKVSDIIDYLNKEYGISVVNLEGGVGDYDLAVFTSITGEAIRREVADYFVKQGEINGAEFYAINNPDKVTLWGVEDKDLYLENLKIYRDSLAYKGEVDEYLGQLTHMLNNLKRHIYTPELLKIDMAYNAYKEGNMDFREYLEFLIERAKEKGVQIRQFTNLYLLEQAMELEDKIDFAKANTERDVLVDELKKGLSKDEMRELVAKSINFKTKRISRKAFYDYLLGKAKELGLDINRFPALSNYIVYVSLYEAVDRSKVMKELDDLEVKIKEPLYQNDVQRQLDTLSRNLALMKNIFAITLTKPDYRYYLDNSSSFDVNNYLEFIDREAPKYRISARPSANILKLDSYREEISRFYEYSFKRDEVFLKNLRFDRIGQIESAVLMTGGFHTENLCELLEKEKISYVSILPKFTSAKDYESPYFELLAGQTTNLQRMLSSVIAKTAMMQIASMLSPLGEDVWGKDNVEVFRAAVLIQTKITEGRRVELVDNDYEPIKDAQGNPIIFGKENRDLERITVARLLKQARPSAEESTRSVTFKTEDGRTITKEMSGPVLDVWQALDEIKEELKGRAATAEERKEIEEAIGQVGFFGGFVRALWYGEGYLSDLDMFLPGGKYRKYAEPIMELLKEKTGYKIDDVGENKEYKRHMYDMPPDFTMNKAVVFYDNTILDPDGDSVDALNGQELLLGTLGEKGAVYPEALTMKRALRAIRVMMTNTETTPDLETEALLKSAYANFVKDANAHADNGMPARTLYELYNAHYLYRDIKDRLDGIVEILREKAEKGTDEDKSEYEKVSKRYGELKKRYEVDKFIEYMDKAEALHKESQNPYSTADINAVVYAEASEYSAGPLKRIGLDEDTGKEARKLDVRRKEFERLARESGREETVAGMEAVVVEADLGYTAAAYQFRNAEGQLVIVLNTNGRFQGFREEAIYHEAREAYWMDRGFNAREAHIIASAEQAAKFKREEMGGLTPYHMTELARMDLDGLTSLLSEDRAYHRSVLGKAASQGADFASIENAVAYENTVRKNTEIRRLAAMFTTSAMTYDQKLEVLKDYLIAEAEVSRFRVDEIVQMLRAERKPGETVRYVKEVLNQAPLAKTQKDKAEGIFNKAGTKQFRLDEIKKELGKAGIDVRDVDVLIQALGLLTDMTVKSHLSRKELKILKHEGEEGAFRVGLRGETMLVYEVTDEKYGDIIVKFPRDEATRRGGVLTEAVKREVIDKYKMAKAKLGDLFVPQVIEDVWLTVEDPETGQMESRFVPFAIIQTRVFVMDEVLARLRERIENIKREGDRAIKELGRRPNIFRRSAREEYDTKRQNIIIQSESRLREVKKEQDAIWEADTRLKKAMQERGIRDADEANTQNNYGFLRYNRKTGEYDVESLVGFDADLYIRLKKVESPDRLSPAPLIFGEEIRERLAAVILRFMQAVEQGRSVDAMTLVTGVDSFTGNIDKGLTEDERRNWREEILSKSAEVKAANQGEGRAVEEVTKRCEQLYGRINEIERMLIDQGLSGLEITMVVKALRNPEGFFDWFEARVENEERYMLGTESALAVNIIQYLKERESETGIKDLIDEYIFHEALEKTGLNHEQIIALTTKFFNRGKREAKREESPEEYFKREFEGQPKLTPLGVALRKFIDVEAEVKIAAAPKEVDVEKVAMTAEEKLFENFTKNWTSNDWQSMRAYMDNVHDRSVNTLEGQETYVLPKYVTGEKELGLTGRGITVKTVAVGDPQDPDTPHITLDTRANPGKGLTMEGILEMINSVGDGESVSFRGLINLETMELSMGERSGVGTHSRVYFGKKMPGEDVTPENWGEGVAHLNAYAKNVNGKVEITFNVSVDNTRGSNSKYRTQDPKWFLNLIKIIAAFQGDFDNLYIVWGPISATGTGVSLSDFQRFVNKKVEEMVPIEKRDFYTLDAIKQFQEIKELVGGKFFNLARVNEMFKDSVPPAVVLSALLQGKFFKSIESWEKLTDNEKKAFERIVNYAVERLQRDVAKQNLNDSKNPLLVSVRSGAGESIPGLMDTVLNLGMNDFTYDVFKNDKKYGEKFAADTYIRFLVSYGKVVLGSEFGAKVSGAIQDALKAGKKRNLGDLTLDQLKKLLSDIRDIYKTDKDPRGKETLEDLKAENNSSDNKDALNRIIRHAVRAVYESWFSEAAEEQKRKRAAVRRLPGTAVTIQKMVFGNRNKNSGAGVIHSIDPNTGENMLFGDAVIEGQGEDVVGGEKVAFKIEGIDERIPGAHEKLKEIAQFLQELYGHPQDIEFTIEDGKLHILQTRNAKLTSRALALFKYRSKASDAGEYISEHSAAIVPWKVDVNRTKQKAAIKGELGMYGVATGKVIMFSDLMKAYGEEMEARGLDKKKYDEEAYNRVLNNFKYSGENKAIVIMTEVTSEDELFLKHNSIGGVIVSTGGRSSHAAVALREKEAPLVDKVQHRVEGEDIILSTIDERGNEVQVTRIKPGYTITIAAQKEGDEEVGLIYENPVPVEFISRPSLGELTPDEKGLLKEFLPQIYASLLEGAPVAAQKLPGTEAPGYTEYDLRRVRAGTPDSNIRTEKDRDVKKAVDQVNGQLLRPAIDIAKKEGLIDRAADIGNITEVEIMTAPLADEAEALSYMEGNKLVIVLNSNGARSEDYFTDPEAMAHMIRHEFIEAQGFMSHREIKHLEYIENERNALTVLNMMALRHMTLEQLDSIAETHSSDPEGLFYRAARAEIEARRARSLLNLARPGIPCAVLLPLTEEQMIEERAKHRDIVSATKRVVEKKFGANVTVFYYLRGDAGSLNQAREKAMKSREFVRDNRALLLAYVSTDMPEADVEKFREEERVGGVVREDLEEDQRVDEVLHVALGVGLIDYVRTGRDEVKSRIRDLLGIMVEDASILEGMDLDELLKGAFSIKIKRIDYGEIDDWKKAQEAILIAL